MTGLGHIELLALRLEDLLFGRARRQNTDSSRAEHRPITRAQGGGCGTATTLLRAHHTGDPASCVAHLLADLRVGLERLLVKLAACRHRRFACWVHKGTPLCNMPECAGTIQCGSEYLMFIGWRFTASVDRITVIRVLHGQPVECILIVFVQF